MIFYTSDNHLGDSRIIDLCRRPYSSLKEMEDDFRYKWNQSVSEADDVYIIGDFSYGYRSDLSLYIKSLNGRKHLIVGNHDKNWLKNRKYRRCFASIDTIKTITDSGRKVVLFHYPLCAFDGSLKGYYHVYGHVHNNTNEPMYRYFKDMLNCFNAGVDVNDFMPVTLDSLIKSNHQEL